MQSRKLKNGKPLNCIHMYATMLLQMKRGNMHTKCMPYDYLPSAFTYIICTISITKSNLDFPISYLYMMNWYHNPCLSPSLCLNIYLTHQ